MANYVLAQSWARANVQDRLWYIEDAEAWEEFMLNEEPKFGDKVYSMFEGKFYIRGSEGWYVLGSTDYEPDV